MAPSKSTAMLTIANLLIPIAILTFASGFFPYKPFLPGLAEYEAPGFGFGAAPPKAPFDKVVFMVVDALRSDFVFSNESAFTFTQGLISKGAAMPFTAHATSPTITMPRVKAITTGSIPSFLDVILNFAESDTTSSLAAQDTWLAQMKAKGSGKLIMYGDDTWLKLFPDTFDRADGTSSFFVADFTEVDNNVTRHVPEELRNDDWNTMVLHYLGMDHIGHKAGPRSPNMLPKQKEMDGIVEQIYTAIETQKHLQDTLLVLCGDHGMNDAGNHGGSAPGETSPALVFMSPKFRRIFAGDESPIAATDEFQFYETVEQSDIAPTLAGLLGFPVPRNNLGIFIHDFFPMWRSIDDQFHMLVSNAKQILNVVTAAYPASLFGEDSPQDCQNPSSDIERLGCDWKLITAQLENRGEIKPSHTDPLFYDIFTWLRHAQDIMGSTASDYNMDKLYVGQAIAFLSIILVVIPAAPVFKTRYLFKIIMLSYSAMMFASSYVEEEHNFWYWAASGWIAALIFKTAKSSLTTSFSCVVVLAGLRLTRRWNQTGQKFAGEPDIARTFLAEHTTLLWALVFAMYMWNCYSLSSTGFPHLPRSIAKGISQLLVVMAAAFKVAFTHEDAPELLDWAASKVAELTTGFSLITRARGVFIGIGLALAQVIGAEYLAEVRRHRFASTRTIHNLLTLFLITQSRATNIPLIMIFSAQFHLLHNLDLNLTEVTITSIIFQYMSFFAFGGTNSISSIDLSSAYNGVSGYNIVAVGILTFVSNWTGPIFWTSATTIMLLRLRASGEKNVLKQYIELQTVFAATSLGFVMVACTELRSHLFIWTVFSPKYLYSMAWSIGQHLGINIGLGSLLFWLGTY
ncbi:major facilitator superfamily transporter protein [Pseudogymnoascus australis]